MSQEIMNNIKVARNISIALIFAAPATLYGLTLVGIAPHITLPLGHAAFVGFLLMAIVLQHTIRTAD